MPRRPTVHLEEVEEAVREAVREAVGEAVGEASRRRIQSGMPLVAIRPWMATGHLASGHRLARGCGLRCARQASPRGPRVP